MMRLYILLIIFSIFWNLDLQSQPKQNDIQLAQFYYVNGDFEKACIYYKKIFSDDNSKPYFIRYIDCLIKTSQLSDAEKVYKKQIKKFPEDIELKLQFASFYLDNNNEDQGKSLLNEIISDIPELYESYIYIINYLIEAGEFNLGLKVIEQGEKNEKIDLNLETFQFQRAKINLINNQKKEAIQNVLRAIEINPYLEGNVQRFLEESFLIDNESNQDFLAIEKEIIALIQKPNNTLIYSELLKWLYIQSSSYDKAFTICISIDKRTQSKGYYILDLATICMDEGAYSVATKAYRYLVSEETDFKIEGQEGILKAGYKQITINRNYSGQEIIQLVEDYQNTLNIYGKAARTIGIIIEYCNILAFYHDSPKDAITELKNALNLKGLTALQSAEVKLNLANILLLDGDIWEASLLYSQIEQDFKYEEIGDQAKFNNAKIFYFDGEFEYAQSQLDVLKGSTSKLISNDAIQLSIAITDNFGLDSNYEAMTWFANAELMVVQHKNDLANILLDSIVLKYPNHSLADEILFLKAKMMEEKGHWESAVVHYDGIISKYPHDILADDALFRKANILENQLKKNEEAKKCYLIILKNYKDSLFTTEARKRLRNLRGDFSEKDL